MNRVEPESPAAPPLSKPLPFRLPSAACHYCMPAPAGYYGPTAGVCCPPALVNLRLPRLCLNRSLSARPLPPAITVRT